jgi:TonB dependent receptor
MLRSFLFLLLTASQFTQANSGELRLTVVDAAGFPLQSTVELVSEANQIQQRLETDPQGALVAKRLPFGTYQVVVAHQGFATFTGLVEIRSALPTPYRVSLNVATVQAQVEVKAGQTLIDTGRTATVHRIGAEAFQQRTTALPGRALPELVTTQPGWLLEANGILHPRGSEYQTQFVVDGLPLTDNRSPAFAPEIDADEVHALSILTGGYPAEYGRKLGGVIEVAGSFDTWTGDAVAEYGWRRVTLSVSGGIADTARYLDPPAEENYTNEGTTAHVTVRAERDFTDRDRAGAIVRYGSARFAVPNEQIQEEAGQRQDRDSREWAGQFSYQRILSSALVADVRGMVRDLSAGLWSNAASTPVIASQDRGLRDLYVKGAITGHRGAHEWKAGGDVNFGTVRERFAYRLTDLTVFDPDTPVSFDFAGRGSDREQALFIQDQIRFGSLTVNAGLRWDRYRLVVDESAVSPRLGVAYAWPQRDLVLRGSYDRAFQTPAVENLLLASSPAVDILSDNVVRLPVRPSRGHFYEGGLTKGLGGRLRVDASYYVRTMNDFADDDVLLNTGVSFPIAFRHADIRGTEITLNVPRWRAVSGSLSYAHMRGVGQFPVTGGLFLGDDIDELQETEEFPLSQDQRHTIRARGSYQLKPAAWVSATAAYNSGLPFEFTGDRDEALDQYGPRIIDGVNFDTGRVRPSLTLDASLGVVFRRESPVNLRVQLDVRNLTNRLTVINFAGVFSGTALAPPRSVAIRLRADF